MGTISFGFVLRAAGAARPPVEPAAAPSALLPATEAVPGDGEHRWVSVDERYGTADAVLATHARQRRRWRDRLPGRRGERCCRWCGDRWPCEPVGWARRVVGADRDRRWWSW